MERVATELRNLARRRRAVLVQLLCMGGCAGLLVGSSPYLKHAPADLLALFMVGVALFSLAAIHFIEQLVSILHTECPRCTQFFFGTPPEETPSPLRKTCTHCGLRLS